MKKSKSFKIGTICCLVGILSVLVFSPSNIFSQGRRVVYESFHSDALEGNLLGDSPDRWISVYLPAAYDQNPDLSFPVIYLLHSYNSHHTKFLSDYHLVTQFDTFFARDDVNPMIIVVASNKNKYGGSWYTNSSVTGNWENFMTDDLISYIDSTYRTLAHRENRGIAGHSMGGYGALKLAMKHPDLYRAVYGLSGANLNFENVVLGTMKLFLQEAIAVENEEDFDQLSWEVTVMIAAGAAFSPNPLITPFLCNFPLTNDGVLIDSVWQKWALHDPYTMVSHYKNNLLQLDSIVFDCGTSDEYLFTATQDFAQKLADENIPHVFMEFDGDHINKLHERVLDHMLPLFSKLLGEPVNQLEMDDYKFPDKFRLFQNYPNPFNPLTAIEFSIPNSDFVTLKIFNLLGEEVEILVSEKIRAGTYKYDWYANDVASGVYLYRLRVGDYVKTRKMVLLK
jgi:S-formylglutathione hydrolase FrmB